MTQTPVLRIRDLSVGFHNGDGLTAAVRGVSFDIHKGETVALVGESGSGKSVTALSILQLLPDSASIEGDLALGEQTLNSLTERELRGIRGSRVGMIFQEPMTSLNPLHRVGRQVAEALQIHQGLRVKAANKRVRELFELVGIGDAEQKMQSYPHELSGGQRQRVIIAMALANDPELLIADEPTTALDVTIQKQILRLLLELQKKLGMAILFISHDLNVVRDISQRICVMQDGKIVEQGETEQLFAHASHPYTQQLLSAEPSGRPEPVTDTNTVLRADGLNVWYPVAGGILGRTQNFVRAATDISFTLRRGETLGVVGESGSGKTSLGMALMRLVASRGTIEFLGQPISDLSQKQLRPLRKQFQMVFQDPFGSLSPRMTIGAIVREGLDVHRIGPAAEREQRVIDTLQEVGIDPDTRHRYPHEFSGGQRQRISIARAVILRPQLIMLDEPTSALDRTVQIQIVELLRDLQKKYSLSYVFISHDLAVVRALSHQILVMKDGATVEQGDANALFTAPAHPYTRELFDAAHLR